MRGEYWRLRWVAWLLVFFCAGHVDAVALGQAQEVHLTLPVIVGESQLIDAVKDGDVTAVRAVLAQGVEVNASGRDGSTALHWAVDRNDIEILELLLDADADVRTVTRFSVTPLSLACVKGNAEIAERLLRAGAGANAVTRGGEPVLMTAARTGDVQTIKVLLAHGANVNAKEPTRDQTALMWAAAEGDVEAIKVLIEAGADIRARSMEREYKKYLAPPTYQRRHGGELPPIQFTPLMFAIRDGHMEAVRTLLDAGVDVNETLPDGTSGLIVATINAHWELAAFLLDMGADPNAAGGGWIALHQIVRTRSLTISHLPHPIPTGRISSLELARKLIAKGANVNARMSNNLMRTDGYRTQLNRIGATPYLLAAKGVDHEMMRLLLANGADPKLTNELGQTPLMIAAGIALHATGEDTGTNKDALEAVKVALAVDPDVNVSDKRSQTALHGAARRGAASVVKLLIDAGARLDVKVKRENFTGDSQGERGVEWTPLTIALGRQHDGKPLFLGSERFPESAALLYNAMKEQGVPIDEHPASLEFVESMLANSE